MGKHIVFITIFLTIGVSWLWPNFGYAFFQEPFTAFASSFIKIGSTLDQSVNAVVDVSLHAQQQAVYMTRAAYHVARKQIQTTKSQTQSLSLSFQHKLESSVIKTGSQIKFGMTEWVDAIASTARLAARQGKHRMVGAKEAINPVESLRELYGVKTTALSLVNYESGIMNYGKNNTRNAMIHDSILMRHNLPSFAQETTQVGTSLPRLAERIIERILVKEVNQESRIMNQGTNDNSNTSMIHDSSFMIQDPRINSLITNVADLTSRLDEKDGSPYRNSALFNMIAQSQRIKTLDDVKITNATIEGYATSKGVSDSLATYLPLGGGHTHGRSHRNLSYALYHP